MVAHSTKRGMKDTTLEVNRIGDDGVKKIEGTIKEIDRGGKKLVLKVADGTEHTFSIAEHATKVVVYSTEHAGKKVAHFFEKL